MSCSECVSKKEFSICGNEKSPFHNQKVEKDNSCDFFEESEAQKHYSNALLLSIEDKVEDSIKEFELAIKLGLPGDDEVYSRAMIGLGYMEMSRLDEGRDAIEKSLAMDAKDNLGKFEGDSTLRLTCLSKLDAAFGLTISKIKEESGLDSAISYAKGKLKLGDYLPGKNMLGLYYELAQLFLEKAQEKYDAGQDESEFVEASVSSIKDCLEAEYDENNEFQLKYRSMAEEGLRNIEKMKAEEESKGKKGLCFIATAVYGSSDDPNVSLLQNYRDRYLARYSIGRWFINRYYVISPHVAKIIRQSYMLRQMVKITILSPIVRLIRAFITYKKGKNS